MRYFQHPMRTTERDPINSGDMRSWFFFYKWRAGETGIRAPQGHVYDYGDVIEKGDRIVFSMDGIVVAIAEVTNVEYLVTWGCNEVFFDSDVMLIPKDFHNFGMLAYGDPIENTVHIDKVAEEAVPLDQIPEGEEPEWLKNLLTKRPS